METATAIGQAAVAIPLPNLLVIVGLIVFVILALLLAIKKGWIRFDGKGLDIGYSEVERKIIRSQMQYMHSEVDALEAGFPKDLNLDHFRTKYILSKVKDCFEEMIIYNHITDDEEYISIKQTEIHNLVVKLAENEYFHTDDFKKFSYEFIEKVIKKFVKIRKYYQSSKNK